LAVDSIPQPQPAFITSSTVTVEAGLPETQGQQDFYTLIVGELSSAGMLAVNSLSGMVQPPALMSRLTVGFGRRFVGLIGPTREG
jgi:hypothetical protein